MSGTKIRHSATDKVFLFFVYTFLAIILVVMTYPLLLVLSNSFSAPAAVTAGKVWLYPVQPSLDGYVAVFKNAQIMTGYANSLFYMLAGTAINMVVTIICAYPLSVGSLPGRRVILALFTFTMFFSGGLIPKYILIKDLGLIDSRWALLIPGAMSVWNMLVMRTYFRTSIPGEMREAALIDGCDEFRYLGRILLPLSGPILAVIALFYAVGHWNAYFNALIFLKSKELYPLQLVLRDILILNNVSMDMLANNPEQFQLRLQLIDVLKYSSIVVASAPLIIIYPFVQRFFVKGIMIGSLKG